MRELQERVAPPTWKDLTTRCRGSGASKVYRRRGAPRAHEGTPILIVIRDTGMGLAPEIMPRIFEIFARWSGRWRARGRYRACGPASG